MKDKGVGVGVGVGVGLGVGVGVGVRGSEHVAFAAMASEREGCECVL